MNRRLRSSLSLLALVTLLAVVPVSEAVAAPLVVETIGETLTPVDVADALVGEGVTVSNVTYTGANEAGGTFSGGTGVVGFEDGIILSSGTLGNVVGPNVDDGITTSHAGPGDEDLDTLSGFTTNDAAVLEFDFVPDDSSLSFRYVFASDEYNEFVNSAFNDVFAFFVNGVNCATVEDDPVSINTINNGNPFGTDPRSHPELYINNDLDDGGGTIDTEMDGLTVVLTCQVAVAQGESNHMKLAIADASDFSLDSNVFLEGGSLTTLDPLTTTKVADSPTSSPGGSNGYTISVANPNASDVTLSSITDTLPAGFTYTLGSTTGVTTDDPTIEGPSLAWSGPFTVPGEGSVSLHLGVTVASEPGEYLNDAGGVADGVSVVPTGPTAPIVVEDEADSQDHVVEEVGPEGGTVETPGDVTPDNPLSTTVIVPPGTGGGVVEITEMEGNDAIDCGVARKKPKRCLWPQLSFITSPSASVENPLLFIFTVDASFIPKKRHLSNLKVFHADTLEGIGVAIPACSGGSFVRCLESVVRLSDGDVRYTVKAVVNGKHRG
jgi:uncharacterized repeat protein (TIGR01451 family)